MSETPHLLVEQLEHWSVAELIPYAKNARTHSPEQVNQIARSIESFGFVNPVLVGDDKVIVAGHGRLLAAQQLGMDRVPVIVLGHLDEVQRRALVLADNKLAENAGWDEDLLKLELQALDDLDFDLDIVGFSDEELDGLLLEEPEGNTEDDRSRSSRSVNLVTCGYLAPIVCCAAALRNLMM